MLASTTKSTIIQIKSREVAEEMYKDATNTALQPIRDYVFEEGIPYQHFITIMALGLQDMVCEKRGIAIRKSELTEKDKEE